jgi:hypothetical protein
MEGPLQVTAVLPAHHTKQNGLVGKNAMRSVLASGLLIALCASASAAVAGHHAKSHQVFVHFIPAGM